MPFSAHDVKAPAHRVVDAALDGLEFDDGGLAAGDDGHWFSPLLGFVAP